MKNIQLYNQDEEIKSLDSYDGSNLVLFFYPKDNTPGCTNEAIEFTSLLNEFEKHNTKVVGISKDSVKSHQNFISKRDLKVELLSDPEGLLHKEFDVIKEKNVFGKVGLGTVRSTFVFNSKGDLVKEFRNVKAKGHAQKVLEFIETNEL